MTKLNIDLSGVPDNPFPAAMLNNQFAALRRHLRAEDILRELPSVAPFAAPRSRSVDTADVAKLLQNAWSTEQMLRMTSELLADKQAGYALQWAFPQAYYSCYLAACAYFKVGGHTETKHGSVIRKLGELMRKGDYPKSVSCLADGGMRQIEYLNITRSEAPSSLHYDPFDQSSVQTQICQFLKSTRERDLEEKKKDLKFRTKSGSRKKNLNKDDWDKVSARIGATSTFSLLYRKRLKSNYDEIETLLADGVEVQKVHGSLCHLVDTFNLIHESFIRRAIGESLYNSVVTMARGSNWSHVKDRRSRIEEICPTGIS